MIKDKNGIVIASTEQQILRWHEHFDNLLNSPLSNDLPALNPPSPQRLRPIRINIEPPSVDEIIAALKELKGHKATLAIRPTLANYCNQYCRRYGILKPYLPNGKKV